MSRMHPQYTNKVFGPAVVPVPLHNKPRKKSSSGSEYAEYGYIGDTINLFLADSCQVAAGDHVFVLANGLSITYGQINRLAGDFYGTTKPISDGKTAQEQSARFIAAYKALAGSRFRQPTEAQEILAVLQVEVNAVNDALHRGEDSSDAYRNLPDMTEKLEALTQARPYGLPTHTGLARINWDSFGSDARTAYNAGHTLALQTAAAGKLEEAYMLNAFADSYLVRCFSAGYLRTPRRSLHLAAVADLAAHACAKFMHTEEAYLGLFVSNPAGERWVVYGSERALEEAARDNLQRCVAAVQASVDEVYAAFTTKDIVAQNGYKAWIIAPVSASIWQEKNFAPLFKCRDGVSKDLLRRQDIGNRRKNHYTKDWTPQSTAIACGEVWRYGLHLESPKVAPFSHIAVAMPWLWHARLYYQDCSGGVLESLRRTDGWVEGADQSPLWSARHRSPFAVINFDGGRRIRVYYVDPQHGIQEHCYDYGGWQSGHMGLLHIQAARETSIAAFTYEMTGDSLRRIHVFCQEEGSNAIQEFYTDYSWRRGAKLPGALSGTSIAATGWPGSRGGSQARVYYQAEDLTIRVYKLDDGIWTAESIYEKPVPMHTQICALHEVWHCVVDDPSVGGFVRVPDVYWLYSTGWIIRYTEVQGSWKESRVVGPLLCGAKFAVSSWKHGRYVRIYYQSPDYRVLEVCSDDGSVWYAGAFVDGG